MATKKSVTKNPAAPAAKKAVKKAAEQTTKAAAKKVTKKAAGTAKKAAPDRVAKRPAPAAIKPPVSRIAPKKEVSRPKPPSPGRETVSPTRKAAPPTRAEQSASSDIDLSTPLLRALSRQTAASGAERAATTLGAAAEFLPYVSLVVVLRQTGKHRHVVATVDRNGAVTTPGATHAAAGTQPSPLYDTLELPERPDTLKEVALPGTAEPATRRGLCVPFDLHGKAGQRWFALWILDEGAPVPSRKLAEIAALFLPGLFPLLGSILAEEESGAALRSLTEQHSRDLLAATQAAEARTRRLDAELQKKHEALESLRAKHAQDLEEIRRHNNDLEKRNASLEERLAGAEAAAKNHNEELASMEQSCAREIQTLQTETEDLTSRLQEARARLQTAETEMARQLALVHSSKDEEIQRLKSDHEQLVADLKQKAAEARAELETGHARFLAEIQEKNDQENRQTAAAHAEKLHALTSNHAREIQRLTSAHEQELERLAATHARDSETRIAKLEEELRLEIQLRDEELEKARASAETAQRSAAESLSEMQRAHAAAIQAQAEQLAAASERQLAELQQSHDRTLSETEQAFAAEKKALTERVTSLEQGHGTALKKAREEAEARVASLEHGHAVALKKVQDEAQAQIARLEAQRKQEQADSEARQKRLEDNHRSLVEGLQAELKGREEQLREQKESVFSMQRALDETRTLLDQEREAHKHTKNQSNERIARIEEEGVLVVEELNGTIKEREAALASLQQSLTALQLRETEARTDLTAARESISALHKERTDLEGRVQELEQRVATERDTHAKALARMQAELDAGLASAAKQVEHAGLALAEREQELKSRSETLQKTEQSLAQAASRIQTLTGDLEEARTREQELLARVDEIERTAEKTHQENRELHEIMRAKNDEIRSYHMEEQRLKRSAQSEVARAAELERMIEDEKERLRQKDEILHRRADEMAALNARIDALGKDVENYLAVLQQRKDTIDSLREDLDTARQQVKNSREEGHLLVEASRALAQIESFPARISYLKDRVLRDIPLSRIVLYSMADDSTVVPVFSHPPLEFSRTPIPLAQTVFGQALASQRPALIQRKAGTEPADLPDPELLHFIEEDRPAWESYRAIYDRVQALPGSSLIVPLVLGTQTEGVLVLASDELLDEKRTDMNMLEHLAPFVATAFREEKDRSRVAELSQTTRHQDSLRRFIEKRSEQMIARATAAAPTATGPAATMTADLHLDQKTRYIAPFLRPDRKTPGTADILQLLDDVAASLKNSPIFTEFRVDPAHIDRLVDGEDAGLLLWLVAEAVTNVVEHSDARRLLIETGVTHGIPGLKIEDDGEGLVRKTGSMSPATGLGFGALHAMAALLHLEMRVTRGEGGLGTSIRLFKK